MNPKQVSLAALALLALVAAPVSASTDGNCDGPRSEKAQTSKSTRRALGRTPMHRRGQKDRLSQEEGSVEQDDEAGGRKKKAKGHGKKKKKKKAHRRRRGERPQGTDQTNG
jgi:hypothetical protein